MLIKFVNGRVTAAYETHTTRFIFSNSVQTVFELYTGFVIKMEELF